MKATETTILKFIGGEDKVFIIPPFQRNYEWTTEQCEELFEDILKNNSIETQEGQLLLYKKTQKLLDRLLFIFFAEDGGLLPPNSMVQILDQWQQLKDLDAYTPLYNRI